MSERDQMLGDIHAVRRKMWEENEQNPHRLIDNIKKEAKEFVEEHGYRYSTKGRYRKIIIKR